MMTVSIEAEYLSWVVCHERTQNQHTGRGLIRIVVIVYFPHVQSLWINPIFTKPSDYRHANLFTSDGESEHVEVSIGP